MNSTVGPSGSVRRAASALAIAGVIEYGLQLALPVVLVRHLSAQAFGDYRLIWFLANTALALFPLFVPQSLFNFLPRADAERRASLIGNATVFVAVAGSLAAVLLLASRELLPDSFHGLQKYSTLAPLFVALWVAASLIDVLPVSDGNARLQAYTIAGLAILRTAALGLAVVLTADPRWLVASMCGFALVKFLLVPAYALSRPLAPRLSFDQSLLASQVRYGLPFAIGNSLFLLRMQADQWIVATFFTTEVFALISIAAVVLSISTLVKQPLFNAILPRLSAFFGRGDKESMCELLRKTYTALAVVLLPTLGLLFAIANEVVEIVYTSQYGDAAPLMQIYLAGQMLGVFGAGYFLLILNLGRLATTISAVLLPVSVALSLAGLHVAGLAGAVAGSVISLTIGEGWALRAVARSLDTTIVRIIRWDLLWRATTTVAGAMTAATAFRHFLTTELSVFPKLVLTSLTYVLVLAIVAVATGLHTIAMTVLRGLVRHDDR